MPFYFARPFHQQIVSSVHFGAKTTIARGNSAPVIQLPPVWSGDHIDIDTPAHSQVRCHATLRFRCMSPTTTLTTIELVASRTFFLCELWLPRHSTATKTDRLCLTNGWQQIEHALSSVSTVPPPAPSRLARLYPKKNIERGNHDMPHPAALAEAVFSPTVSTVLLYLCTLSNRAMQVHRFSALFDDATLVRAAGFSFPPSSPLPLSPFSFSRFWGNTYGLNAFLGPFRWRPTLLTHKHAVFPFSPPYAGGFTPHFYFYNFIFITPSGKLVVNGWSRVVTLAIPPFNCTSAVSIRPDIANSHNNVLGQLSSLSLSPPPIHHPPFLLSTPRLPLGSQPCTTTQQACAVCCFHLWFLRTP